MRRALQQLPMPACEAILSAATSGVLALIAPTGAPYGVPLSFCWAEGKVIFHGAPVGLKMDCIVHDARASFTVIGADDVRPDEFTTAYRSVILRGRVEVVSDPAEAARLAILLADKYRPGHQDAAAQQVEASLKHMRIFTLTPDEITGKQGRILLEKEQNK